MSAVSVGFSKRLVGSQCKVTGFDCFFAVFSCKAAFGKSHPVTGIVGVHINQLIVIGRCGFEFIGACEIVCHDSYEIFFFTESGGTFIQPFLGGFGVSHIHIEIDDVDDCFQFIRIFYGIQCASGCFQLSFVQQKFRFQHFYISNIIICDAFCNFFRQRYFTGIKIKIGLFYQ